MFYRIGFLIEFVGGGGEGVIQNDDFERKVFAAR
jgi:hypothetical protein